MKGPGSPLTRGSLSWKQRLPVETMGPSLNQSSPKTLWARTKMAPHHASAAKYLIRPVSQYVEKGAYNGKCLESDGGMQKQVRAEGGVWQDLPHGRACVVSRREGSCRRTIESCSVLASLSGGGNFCARTSLRLPLNNKTSFRKSHCLTSLVRDCQRCVSHQGTRTVPA